MNLHVVMAYALLIWWSRERPFAAVAQSTLQTWSTILVLLALISVASRLASSTALATLRTHPDGPQRAQHDHHRNMFLLRGLTLLMFGADVTLTRWNEMIKETPILARIPGLTDLVIISPFLVASVLVLLATYPIDRAVRQVVAQSMTWHEERSQSTWGLRAYLSFNIRHQLLAVVVPMTFILIVYDLTRSFDPQITAAIGIPWAPDIALGLTAAAVFIIAPWMLKHIWTTHPLPPGPLRSELESFCNRIGLKCSDILIWRSGGMIVNAAVMGIVRHVRYIVLSDGLVDALDRKQIQAVFGHEAGHVRHKHIPFFLLFALASMLLTSGVMEILFRLSLSPGTSLKLGNTAIQIVGFVTIIGLWGVGFGFVSRRFECQADLFGARCVAPDRQDQCALPCSVHSGTAEPTPPGNNLCATGAEILAGALDGVALLNGIPRKERSWRHSSIENRVEFVKSLAADPKLLQRFERLISIIKYSLLIVCTGGLALGAYFLWPYVIDALSRHR